MAFGPQYSVMSKTKVGTKGPQWAGMLGAHKNWLKMIHARQTGRFGGPGGRQVLWRTRQPDSADLSRGAGGFAGRQLGRPGSLDQVGSSVTPGQLITPEMTNRAVSQRAAQLFAENDPLVLRKQFARPGRSFDAGTAGLMAPQLGAAAAQVGQARVQQPLQDFLANQQFQLAGEQMQGREQLGLANALLSQRDIGNRVQQRAIAALLGLV